MTVAASLHWLSTCRDAFLFEDCVEDSPLRHELTHEKVQAVDGWITVPDGPGLGVTLERGVRQSPSGFGIDLSRPGEEPRVNASNTPSAGRSATDPLAIRGDGGLGAGGGDRVSRAATDRRGGRTAGRRSAHDEGRARHRDGQLLRRLCALPDTVRLVGRSLGQSQDAVIVGGPVVVGSRGDVAGNRLLDGAALVVRRRQRAGRGVSLRGSFAAALDARDAPRAGQRDVGQLHVVGRSTVGIFGRLLGSAARLAAIVRFVFAAGNCLGRSVLHVVSRLA